MCVCMGVCGLCVCVLLLLCVCLSSASSDCFVWFYCFSFVRVLRHSHLLSLSGHPSRQNILQKYFIGIFKA